jgi:hypothetical protein
MHRKVEKENQHLSFEGLAGGEGLTEESEGCRENEQRVTQNAIDRNTVKSKPCKSKSINTRYQH